MKGLPAAVPLGEASLMCLLWAQRGGRGCLAGRDGKDARDEGLNHVCCSDGWAMDAVYSQRLRLLDPGHHPGWARDALHSRIRPYNHSR